MTRRFSVLAPLLALALAACPKAAPPTTLNGTDDENMDQLASQLEEFHTKTELACNDWCSTRRKVCDLSKSACEIAGKHTDRDDMQKKCTSSQEECARYNESCTSCSAK
jgi:hypothetical protein